MVNNYRYLYLFNAFNIVLNKNEADFIFIVQ